MSQDVAQFLMWAAEPKLEERKGTGLKVILFLIVLTGADLRAEAQDLGRRAALSGPSRDRAVRQQSVTLCEFGLVVRCGIVPAAERSETIASP